MYRKPGSQSVLSGALSGPYTGGKRLLSGALLDPSVRERLNLATAGRGSPTPIAYVRPASKETRRAAWGLILSTMLLTWLFALGLGDLYSDWAMPPRWMAAPYIALCLLFALCLIPLLRRRALYGGGAGGALRPGRYLFPLDAVDVGMPDGAGGQTIEVRPLGDARDARIEGEGKQMDLVIAFEGGERVRFPLRGDPSGEIALRRLEHAQHLIEEVTYTKALEQAFTNDVFFDLRVDASWERFAPTSGPAPVRAKAMLSLVLGRHATPVFVAAGVALGVGAFFTRVELGDVALFNQAEDRGTVAALDRYLVRGNRKRLAALDHRQRLLDAAEAQKKLDPAERAPIPPQPTDEERCLERLGERTSTTHPETAAYLADGIRATHGARNRLWIEFADDVGPDVPAVDLDLAEAEVTFSHALSYAFGEICSSVLSVKSGKLGAGEQGIVVHNRVTAGRTPWPLDAEGTVARRLTFVFRVDFVGVDGKRLDGFVLTLEPPPAAPTKTRDRSLFDLSRLPGASANLVHAAQTARAYDRLYDEVWTLLFDGDPHVVWGRPNP